MGIGLKFHEVQSPQEAEFKIGFEQGAGSWSYVGRDAVDLPQAADPTKRTMNFGWSLLTPHGFDTAIHEIGHALGFPHEHQNPNSGIVWDEPQVLAQFSGPPNNWSEDKIRWNILRKIDPAAVEGSNWDVNSIMHYQFGAGLIQVPAKYQNSPLIPTPGLSPVDKSRVRAFYPATNNNSLPQLRPFESQRLRITPAEQVDFYIEPEISREYTLQTFGQLDTVMVLFEDTGGETIYLDGDDDSGTDYNAEINIRLIRGRRYIVRVRLYFGWSRGQGSIMLW